MRPTLLSSLRTNRAKLALAALGGLLLLVLLLQSGDSAPPAISAARTQHYDYCHAPLPRASPPHFGARLLRMAVVARHGDRAPLLFDDLFGDAAFWRDKCAGGCAPRARRSRRSASRAPP